MIKALDKIKYKIEHNPSNIIKHYYKLFLKYSFVDCKCSDEKQFEASITRLYHTIEKGLAYDDYRPGFGKANIEKLLISLEQYCESGYDTTAFFYRTALSCLKAYIKKNLEYDYYDPQMVSRIENLKGEDNELGGAIIISKPIDVQKMNYRTFASSRHSIRHFSNTAVDVNVLIEAIKLAQYTPSACNRQGWKTRIIANENIKKIVLSNQNGNRGFDDEIDKVLLVTADLRAQQRDREMFQAYIDGGMYAESVLNSLYYYGIGAVPLSASLTIEQESNIRNVVSIEESEVFILLIGVGNYPECTFKTTRSERKPIDVEVI